MTNVMLLYSKVVLNGETWKDLAKLLNISEQALARKKNGGSWNQFQIKKIVDHYNLTPQDTIAIFFA